jgi:hypothetical protein
MGRAVYANSSLKECISVAGKWLQTCLGGHKECISLSQHARPLPTRVIDVGDENCHPRLIAGNGKTDTWIALSYCWGGDSQFVFNDKTAHDLQTGIPVNDWPATLRDFVMVTRSLGIKYVWIDALCIKQDSAEDWAREAAKMRDVYSGAVLTVVAANSPSTHSGMFSQRSSESLRATVEWRTPTDLKTSKIHLRPGSELWDHALSSSPLMGRGWTLQESLLAPRTLSYGAQQIIWECPTYQADEGGRITRATEDYRSKAFIQNLIHIQHTEVVKAPQSLLQMLSLRSNKPEIWWKSYGIANPYDKWNDIIEQSMKRSLTKDYDVLPALSGLARVFQGILKDEYCAGLWKGDILSSLMWGRLPKYPADQSTRFDLTRPSEYLAPSWSWTSILGRGSIMGNSWRRRDALKTSAHSVAKIIRLRTFPKSDPFGQVTGGELVLHTRFGKIEKLPPVYSVEHEFHDETPKSLSHSAFQELVYTTMRDVPSMVYEFFQQHSPCVDQEFGAVELVRWDKSPGSQGLGIDLLIVESTGRQDEYRRIANMHLRKLSMPDEDAVGTGTYQSIILENNAYDEVIKRKWKKRIVTLV